MNTLNFLEYLATTPYCYNSAKMQDLLKNQPGAVE